MGVSEGVYHSWAFSPINLTPDQHLRVAKFTIANFSEQGWTMLQTAQQERTLSHFLQSVQMGYQPKDKVPFHSFAHAVDVTHAVGRVMRVTQSSDFLSEP